MNRALWPSTWGYYLEQMMGLGDFNGQQPGAFPEAEIDANLECAQQHFLDHVRAGGPLPTLRAGKQPYGILPVTALDLWGAAPEDGKLASRDDAVVAFVRRLPGLLGRSRAAPRRAWAITRIRTSTSLKCSPWTGCPRATPSGTSSGSSTPRNCSSSCALRRPTSGIACNGRRRSQALGFIAGLRGVTPRAALTLCDPVRSGLSCRWCNRPRAPTSPSTTSISC